MSHKPQITPPANRRSFFAMLATIVAGTLNLLTPLAVGLASFFSPLFKKAPQSRVRLALLDQVPDDGLPRSFPVVTDRVDAWTKYPSQQVGSVYLIRQPGSGQPTALTAKCPHAGCFISYKPGDDLFRCPCHTSAFKLDGTRSRGDQDVAPRDMDRLEVEIRKRTTPAGEEVAEVWIEFVDFQTGHEEAKPSA